MDVPSPQEIALGNDNERMIVANLWSYWAHLSIYRFALPWCAGRVMDVGTGVGYGAAYLADHGASVQAFDFSAESIAHARQIYSGKNVQFEVADLNQPLASADRMFDLVFSSNVFEHIARVDDLARECARVVKADGTVIVAVPPITLAWIAEDDSRNQHHIHHLPPASWHTKLSRFFANIRCHGHQGIGRWGDQEVQKAEIDAWVDATTIRETDFEFPEVAIERLNNWQCITAVFVCSEPRSEPLAETLAERMPAEWCEGAIAARIIAEERVKNRELAGERDRLLAEIEATKTSLAAENSRLHDELADQLASSKALQDACNEILRSTSWRLTGPLRALAVAARRGR